MTHRPLVLVQVRRQFSSSAKMSPKEAREKAMRDKFLRVDHAGEVGADRIYAGQMAVLGNLNSFSAVVLIGSLSGFRKIKQTNK